MKRRGSRPSETVDTTRADAGYDGRTGRLVEVPEATAASRDARPEVSLREHELIAAAIEIGDAEAAQRSASEHMCNITELRMKMLLDGY